MNDALVSVVITTRNEERHIRACLHAIKVQTYSAVEIIVVDNSSQDATQSIAREFTSRVYTLGPERSAQRNHGMIDQAHGVYVLYLDADMILAPGLVAACVRQMQGSPSTVGLYISEVILGRGWWSRVRRHERSFYDATVIDAARFIRRDSFIRVGGFDLSLNGPEDWDLDKKLKKLGRLLLLPRQPTSGKWDAALEALIRSHGVDTEKEGNALFHNESAFNVRNYLRKKSYYAKTFDAYRSKWGANDPDVKRQLSGYYRMLGVFIEDEKFWKLIRHPILTFGMYLLRGLVAVNYVIGRMKRRTAS
jgi:glycosyltransferase involved in cell wall biosynthesis